MEEPFQRAAAWTTIEPDKDLIFCSWIDRWEEPKVQLSIVGIVGNVHESGIRLADIEIDRGQASTIDNIFCRC